MEALVQLETIRTDNTDSTLKLRCRVTGGTNETCRIIQDRMIGSCACRLELSWAIHDLIPLALKDHLREYIIRRVQLIETTLITTNTLRDLKTIK